MSNRERHGCLLILAATAMLMSGCTAIYPVESFFRSPDHVQGVVVDQDDKPVPKAKLVFDEWEHVPYIPIPFGPTTRFSRTRTTKTDDSGAFALSFKREGLSLKAINKTGYVFEPCVTPTSWSRRYSRQQRASPQGGTFLLYDVSGVDTSATTVASTPAFRFTTDGADYYLELTTGQISTTATERADLVFAVKQVGATAWLVTIRALDGGLWASANEMPYAPRDGYVSGFSTLYGQGYAINYRAQYDFFAKTQTGKHYSRIIADIIKEPQTIQFHYVVNRTGSRFLFIPERVDNRGLHGPPHRKEGLPTNFQYVILGEGQPWWRKQEHTIYPVLSESEFTGLFRASDRDGLTRRYVASQLYTPVSILQELSRSANRGERWVVAGNPALPRDVLLRLVTDQDESVRRRAQETLARDLNVHGFLQERNYFRAGGTK